MSLEKYKYRIRSSFTSFLSDPLDPHPCLEALFKPTIFATLTGFGVDPAQAVTLTDRLSLIFHIPEVTDPKCFLNFRFQTYLCFTSKVFELFCLGRSFEEVPATEADPGGSIVVKRVACGNTGFSISVFVLCLKQPFFLLGCKLQTRHKASICTSSVFISD